MYGKITQEESDHSSQTFEVGSKRYNSNVTESETSQALGDIIQKKRKTESPKHIKFNKDLVIAEIDSIAGKYEKQEIIGEGGFGVVYKVLDKDTN